MDWDQIKEMANERRLVGNIKGISRETQENDKGFDQAGVNLKNLRRIARIATARCTRSEAKFEELVQRHYTQIYPANFFVMLCKVYPPFVYQYCYETNLSI